MTDRRLRLDALKKIIEANTCNDQSQLLEALAAKGINTTQSTLSRDLAALKVRKVKSETDGSSLFVLPQATSYIRVHTPFSEDSEAHWYVLLTRPLHEKVVAERLSALGIENWLPVQKIRRRWSDRMKTITVPVISGMVFVHCTDSVRKERTFSADTKSYLMDHTSGMVAIIPDRQMNDFRLLLDDHYTPIEFTERQLQPGVKVKVVRGTFAGMEGELLKNGENAKVVLRIDHLGCASVAIDPRFVEEI